MTKFLGFKKVKTAVFISGKGSNLKNLIQFGLKKNSPIKIEYVISNNFKAKGLNFAKRYKINFKVYQFNNQDKTEKQILNYLKKNRINLICLAGFMKILSSKFIKRYKFHILNIHPSLLPKYKGLNTHERVIKGNESFTGCTVHLVNAKLDSGRIILQKKIRIYKNDTPKKLAKRVLKHEHIIYPKAITKLLANL